MQILICDDHKIVRDGLNKFFSNWKVTLIEEASDGDEALVLLKSDVFDIILLDISLPGKSGLEFFNRLKQMAVNKRADTKYRGTICNTRP